MTPPPMEPLDSSPVLPADLVRVLEWLRDHPLEPVDLAKLAQIAGIRPRTLETQFRMFLGTTPLGWVRRMRLARASGIAELERANHCDQRCAFQRLWPDGAFRNSISKSVWTASIGDYSAGQTIVQPPRSGHRRGDPTDVSSVAICLCRFSTSYDAALEELAPAQELAPAYGGRAPDGSSVTSQGPRPNNLTGKTGMAI